MGVSRREAKTPARCRRYKRSGARDARAWLHKLAVASAGPFWNDARVFHFLDDDRLCCSAPVGFCRAYSKIREQRWLSIWAFAVKISADQISRLLVGWKENVMSSDMPDFKKNRLPGTKPLCHESESNFARRLLARQSSRPKDRRVSCYLARSLARRSAAAWRVDSFLQKVKRRWVRPSAGSR